MCMQTRFGCCIKDGRIVEKKVKKTKKAKSKKEIQQTRVEFE